jgi:hypothetical protein
VGKNNRKKIERAETALYPPFEYFKRLNDYKNEDKFDAARDIYKHLMRSTKTKIPFKPLYSGQSSSKLQVVSSSLKDCAPMTSQQFEFIIDSRTKEII